MRIEISRGVPIPPPIEQVHILDLTAGEAKILKAAYLRFHDLDDPTLTVLIKVSDALEGAGV